MRGSLFQCSQMGVDLRDSCSPFADAGGNSLSRPRADIADSEDAWAAGLERVLRGLTGQDEPLLIERDTIVEPPGVRLRADEEKQIVGLDIPFVATSGGSELNALQVAFRRAAGPTTEVCLCSSTFGVASTRSIR